MQSERHPSSEDYANVLGRGHTLRDTLSFLSFCNIHDSLRIQTIAWEGKPITKVAKLDFQVVAFGHLFSIACLMLRNAAIGCLPLTYLTRVKLLRCIHLFRFFAYLVPLLSLSLCISILFQFLSLTLKWDYRGCCVPS